MKVCIYGASSMLIDQKYIDVCEQLGEQLAKRGHSLVYGAGASGLMGASARGFKRGGGFVHGVIPRFFEENGYEEVFYDADKITRTDNMADRKEIMENECNAFIIVPGGIGTFEEFFQCLTLKQLGRHNKAIVVFNCLDYYKELKAFMNNAVEEKFLTPEVDLLFKYFENIDDIIEYIENYVPEARDNFLLKNFEK